MVKEPCNVNQVCPHQVMQVQTQQIYHGISQLQLISQNFTQLR